jgi:hypothetical protein
MKTIAALFIASLFSLNTMGQSDPSCVDFVVDSIAITPLTGQMQVTIKNNCTNCSSGLNGCVYWEMMVIRSVAPFDTLASSSCFCLQTPNNSTSKLYSFLSSVPILPPLNELQVSFKCGPFVGCDTVPFSSALLLSSVQKEVALSIMPNPIKDYVSIQLTASDISLEVIDVLGKICITKKVDTLMAVIDFSALGNGLYFIQVKDKMGHIQRQYKVTKE